MGKRLGAAVSLVAVGTMLAGRPAHACHNAVLVDDERVATLKEADRALDEGDVALAHQLVRPLFGRKGGLGIGPNLSLEVRARRIDALATVRDPSATHDEVEGALAALAELIAGAEHSPESALGSAFVSPALLADHGEALERSGRDAEAIAKLEPLADKNLIGSPYALAALARATARRDGVSLQKTTAYATCITITDGSRQCEGVYPRPPLLRGSAFGYLASGLVLALAALRRRRERALPWSAYRERLFAAIAVAGGALAFFLAHERQPSGATTCALVAVLLAGPLQRRLFLRACRAGTIEGLRIRPHDENDPATVPALRVLGGPTTAEILERVPAPAYRESAREPILRVERRPVPTRLFALTVTLVFVFAGCATIVSLTTRSR